MRYTRSIALALGTLLMASCESSGTTPLTPGGGEPVPQAQLNFLRPAAGNALRTDSVSFWAVKGQNREIAMYYRPIAGSTDSVRFLRFRVRDETLLRRPNGVAFLAGDSVRITIRILDLSKLITQFEPSGLVFNAQRPAELRLDFSNADKDFNRDGVVNQGDQNAIASFAIWKQEAVGQPWFKLSSLVEISGNLSEVKADLVSFTSYAIAY